MPDGEETMPAAGVKGARVKPVATSPTQFSCSTTTTSTSTTTSTAPSRRVCHLGAVFLLAVAMSCLLLGLQLNAMLMPGDAWAQENAQQHQQRKVHRSPFALSTLSYPMVTREMMKVATKEVMDFSSGLSNPERAERIAKRKQLKAELEERQASILEWQSKLDLAPNQRAQLAEDKMQLERDKAIMLNDQKVYAREKINHIIVILFLLIPSPHPLHPHPLHHHPLHHHPLRHHPLHRHPSPLRYLSLSMSVVIAVVVKVATTAAV
eukprot:CAMPEP_0167810192 /NCGR_PEP_ID=MMETSP0111_2-20121227/24229_1 /TAXON_ID=91324 /ORGANISM="Lotharella globosa, Strain CCCM811" /LENGTH=264 /DNA_ID=CAMNT_0007708693 /DNA_START=20 /DNA_END=814 /DNA_ORIENTATION=+